MFDPKTRILVVDDMIMMRRLVSKTLKGFGFENIVDAPDGKAAWEILTTSNPPIDLVVSDWNMPVMTGLEFLKQCRADERYKNLPFILVTAEAEKTQIVEAIKSGVSNYVVKPFTPAGLQEKIAAAYKKHFGQKKAAA